jgi:hypothetical protein
VSQRKVGQRNTLSVLRKQLREHCHIKMGEDLNEDLWDMTDFDTV